MDAHELHGELFVGEQAMNLGLTRVGENIAFTVVVDAGVSGARAHLSESAAKAAWFHLGELLGYDGAVAERVEQRARELAREWIRLDENATRELAELRERTAGANGVDTALADGIARRAIEAFVRIGNPGFEGVADVLNPDVVAQAIDEAVRGG